MKTFVQNTKQFQAFVFITLMSQYVFFPCFVLLGLLLFAVSAVGTPACSAELAPLFLGGGLKPTPTAHAMKTLLRHKMKQLLFTFSLLHPLGLLYKKKEYMAKKKLSINFYFTWVQNP